MRRLAWEGRGWWLMDCQLAAWDAERQELNAGLAAARADLAAATTRADETARKLDAVTTQLEVTASARTEAEDRAHSAERREQAESARAERAESALAGTQQRAESLQGELSQSSSKLATAIAERDAARSDVAREQHAPINGSLTFAVPTATKSSGSRLNCSGSARNSLDDRSRRRLRHALLARSRRNSPLFR